MKPKIIVKPNREQNQGSRNNKKLQANMNLRKKCTNSNEKLNKRSFRYHWRSNKPLRKGTENPICFMRTHQKSL